MESPEEKEESNIESYSKVQENENYPLRTMDIIDNVSDKIEKSNENRYKNIIIIIIVIFFFFLILFLILLAITNLTNTNDDLYQTKVYNPQRKTNLKKSLDNNKIKQKKINVGFIYSSLSGNGIARFMIVTGEYFIKTGKYNVFFITKPKQDRELSYNKQIKRVYVYNNRTLIRKTCNDEKIDFLIVNNVFSESMINWFKSLRVKIIGIFHGVFMSPMFNNSTHLYRYWKNLELYDAFIHITADDYYYYENLGFKRNIFIPNLYTFEPSETPSSNLSSHNIMMLGRLNDKKKGLIYALQAMQLIIKDIPDAKLYLISSNEKSKELTNNIKKYKLVNKVIFVPFTPNISDYFLESSVFFFTSLTEAFPMALNEAKAYGLPCVTFDVSYSLPFQSGVIKVDTFDYVGLAREVIHLLKDYDYRIKMGKEAKKSLDRFTNEGTTNLWGRLFTSLKSGENEYQKFRKEIINEFYNPKIAQEHMEQQFEYLKMYNSIFKCHSIQNFTNLTYINNIEVCQNVSRRR